MYRYSAQVGGVLEGGKGMKQYIRLEPLDDSIPRKHKPQGLTEQEKLNRIYALADKLGVKIGNDSRGV